MLWGRIPLTPVLLTLAFVLATVYSLWRFFAFVRANRFVEDTPLARIRSAAQGYVHIQGRAGTRAGDRITAPLSGRECVWWDYTVEKREVNSKDQTRWSTIEQGTSVTPFTLTDDDGQCTVGPVGADVTPTSHETWYGPTPKPIPLVTVSSTLLSGEQDYRYKERIIASGVQLTVLGDLRSHSLASEIDEQARQILATWKRDPARLRTFDANHDGRIDVAEWESVRAAAHAEAQAAFPHSQVDKLSVVAQTTHGEPFVIAPLTEKQLLSRTQLYAAISLAASLLFLSLTVWELYGLTRLQGAG